MADETPIDASPNPNDELPFDKMILAAIDRRETEAKRGEKKRLPLCVTLHYRYMNDHASYWDKDLGWVNVPGGGLMTWPIIGRVVWANTANWLATKIGVEAQVSNSDPFLKGAEIVCQQLYPQFETDLWTDQNEALMSLYCQLYCNWFGYSEMSKDEGYVKIPEAGSIKIEAADPEFYCKECGAGGPATDMATETPKDLAGPQRCPECGQESAFVEASEDGEHDVESITNYRDTPKLKNTFRVVPSFLIRADELNSKAGDFSEAHWFFYYTLHHRYELKAAYGKAAEKLKESDGKEWNDGVKWWHALETNTAPLSQTEHYSESVKNRDDDLLQTCRHWFVQGVFSNWTAPEDFELDSDKCKFDIKKGETVAESFKRRGKPYVGLFVITSGKTILWIGSQKHKDRWVAGLWLMNGASAWGKPQQELLDIQEGLNNFFSMFHEHGMRSSMPHLILDGTMLDHNNLKNKAGGVSYTKKGVPRTHPLKWYYERIDPARMSGDMVEIWSLMQQGVDDISGVSKASIGQSDSANRTMGGQALLTQRSMGLLIPSQKSKGTAKGIAFKQYLKNAQLYWDDDQIRQVLSNQDKSWDDLNIQAFRQLSIECDVDVKTTEGSDIPVTYMEREMRMMQTMASGVLWNPEIPIQLRAQVARLANIDFDPDNIESERRHQSAVLKKLRAACQYVEEQGLGYIYAPETGMTINPAMIEKMQTMPGVEILPDTENLEFAVQFFNSHLLAAHTAEKPDQLFIAVLQKRVEQLQAIGIQKAAALQQAQAKTEQQAKGVDPERDDANAEKDRQLKLQVGREQQAHDLKMEQMKLSGEAQGEMADKIPEPPRQELSIAE